MLGEPAECGRFGFAARSALRLPGPPPSHFMALALGGGVIPSGEASGHDAFAAAP